MREKGFNQSPTMCTDKCRNLLKEFKKAKHQDRGRKKKKRKKERRLKKERKGGKETDRKIWVYDVIFKSGLVFICSFWVSPYRSVPPFFLFLIMFFCFL